MGASSGWTRTLISVLLVAAGGAAAACGGGAGAWRMGSADQGPAVDPADVEPLLPPGDDAWTRWDGDGGSTRSAANTIPWYPEQLLEVALRDKLDPSTLRRAGRYVLAGGKHLVHVVDLRSGEVVARLCVSELRCGDGDDEDYLAHRWDPCLGGDLLQVDETGRWAVFAGAVSDSFSGDWHFKVFDLQALEPSAGGDAPVVDAVEVFTVPRPSDVVPWFEGYLVSAEHLLLWYRQGTDTSDVQEVLQVRSLPDGEVVWERTFQKMPGASMDPDVVTNESLSSLRFRWPFVVFVDATGRRIVAYDVRRDPGSDELWRLPETPGTGMFNPAALYLVDDAAVTFWGDTSGEPEPFVRYGLPGGEVTRSCSGTPGGGEVGVEWAAVAPDGSVVLGNGGPGLRRGLVGPCSADLVGWSDLSSDLQPPRPDPSNPPALYGSAAALNVGLYGVGGDRDPSVAGIESYALLWPFAAAAPTALLGPWPRDVPESCPLGANQRSFIVAGHRIAALTAEPQSRLLLYGDETPPQVEAAELEGQGSVRFRASDAGGPLWGAWLAVQPASGGNVTLLRATAAESPDGWRVDLSELARGEYLVAPLAVDLSGNWTLGPAAALRWASGG